MPDWRWVTQVKHTPSPGNTLAPVVSGMWINIEQLDQIMPLAGHHYQAQTRLGWLASNGWHYIFVAEQIDPTRWGEQQPTTHERTTHADSALEPTDPT